MKPTVKGVLPPIPEDFKLFTQSHLGTAEADALIKALDTAPSVSLRLNRRKTGSEYPLPYPDMTPVPWADGGFWLSQRPKFTLNPWIHAGAFYVQEAASMWLSQLVTEVADAENHKPLNVLDLCAAPGGKSIAAIEALPEGSVVVSNEVTPQRASVLKENMMKWGFPGSIVTSADAASFGSTGPWVDLLVVDAPCSGEGMMRKESMARTQWSERLTRQCAALQRTILEDALPALRPGGWLVYSTCTFNPAENEENVSFLQRGHGLELAAGPRHFYPHRDNTEGLFMALLHKPASEAEVPSDWVSRVSGYSKDLNRQVAKQSPARKGSKGAKSAQAVNKSDLEGVSNWLEGDWELTADGGQVWAETAGMARILERLRGKVKILSPGLKVAETKGKDLMPSHALALSMALKRGAFPESELGAEEAVRYLKRENITLPPGTPAGYVLVTYLGIPLGFVKNIGTRANNLYPKELRILNA